MGLNGGGTSFAQPCGVPHLYFNTALLYMPNVLHVIEYLDLGGASRSTIATAKYAARQGRFDHTILALVRAEPAAIELAEEAGISVVSSPNPEALNSHIADADIVEISYWNAPFTQALLRQNLPATRLVFWYHIAGDHSPHVIPPAIAAMPDLNIAGCPFTYDDHPLFRDQLNLEIPKRTAMVYDSADFERLDGIFPKEHQGFNIGYIGTIDFVKMHPEYVSMSASIDVPESRFVVCGNGIQNILMQQAEALHAADRFDFKGYVSDIGSVIETLDVYGYPLCENTYAAAELNLQEVMFAGVPPVVFPYGGVKRLINHNETGLIVHSAEEYKRAIEYLYYNPVERKRLGQNAAVYARRHFGAENAAHTLNALYERLMNQPKRFHAWNCRPDSLTAGSQISPPPATTAQLFIDSLGEHGSAFKHSIANDASSLGAETEIAGSTDLVAKTGFMQYRSYNPADPHLRLWTGLYMERQGAFANAVSEYAGAIENGLTDWRVQWYLARTLFEVGKLNEAERIYDGIRQQNPDFDAVTGDTRFQKAAVQSSPLTPAPAQHESAPALSFSMTPDAKPGETEIIPTPEYRVSAIISTYNSEAFIDGCMHDLVNQSLFKKGELEIVVVDACSEQNERAIVERYQAYYDHIQYVRTSERETLYASWNRAIKMASGKFITNANADDRHRNDALEVMADYLDAHPEFALLYAGQIDTSIPNETFETTTSKKFLNWPTYSYAEMERHCIIGSQPMWRRNLHDKYGYFREEFTSAGDYEFWLRIGKNETFYRYPDTLGLYYRNMAGIEHGSDASKQETLRIWQEYGMFERSIPLILGGRLVTSAQIAQVNQTVPNHKQPPAIEQLTTPPPDLPISDPQPQLAPAVSQQTPKPIDSPAATIENGLDVKPSFDVLISQFENALHAKEHYRAITIAEKAIFHYGHLPYPFVLKAIAHRQLNDFEPALEALELSISIDETPEALVELMQLAQATGNALEAKQTGDYIRQKYPDWGVRLASLAATSRDANNAELKKPANENDLDFTRQNFDELKQLFEQYLLIEDVKHAEKLALAATQRFPNNHEAWVLQATLYRLNGQLLDAQEAIQRSLLIQDSPEALLELMQLYIVQGKKGEAQDIADTIATIFPQFSGKAGTMLEA